MLQLLHTIDSRHTRDAILLDWFPHKIPFPIVTTDDYLIQTAEDMLAFIRQKLASTRKKTIPLLTFGSKILNAFSVPLKYQ